jgi:hypothetical protein
VAQQEYLHDVALAMLGIRIGTGSFRSGSWDAEGGRFHELLPITGEVAGMVKETLPGAEIVLQMVNQAEAAMRGAAALSRRCNP